VWVWVCVRRYCIYTLNVRIYIHMCVCVCVNIYIYTYTYTYIYIYLHIVTPRISSGRRCRARGTFRLASSILILSNRAQITRYLTLTLSILPCCTRLTSVRCSRARELASFTWCTCFCALPRVAPRLACVAYALSCDVCKITRTTCGTLARVTQREFAFSTWCTYGCATTGEGTWTAAHAHACAVDARVFTTCAGGALGCVCCLCVYMHVCEYACMSVYVYACM
jgi:hypothetical protein